MLIDLHSRPHTRPQNLCSHRKNEILDAKNGKEVPRQGGCVLPWRQQEELCHSGGPQSGATTTPHRGVLSISTVVLPRWSISVISYKEEHDGEIIYYIYISAGLSDPGRAGGGVSLSGSVHLCLDCFVAEDGWITFMYCFDVLPKVFHHPQSLATSNLPCYSVNNRHRHKTQIFFFSKLEQRTCRKKQFQYMTDVPWGTHCFLSVLSFHPRAQEHS